MINDYVRQQKKKSSLLKEVDGHPIYQSMADFGRLKKGVGRLKICDFGAAVLGDVPVPHSHDIQPAQFCAPEVLLKGGWTYSADIWNLGMVVSIFHIATRIRSIPLMSHSLHSCGSFWMILRSLMGSGQKVTGTPTKPISLR